MEGGWAAPGKAGGEGEKPGKWSEMRARGRRKGQERRFEKCCRRMGNTEEEGTESTHTYTRVCVCRQLPLCLLPRTVSNRCF